MSIEEKHTMIKMTLGYSALAHLELRTKRGSHST